MITGAISVPEREVISSIQIGSSDLISVAHRDNESPICVKNRAVIQNLGAKGILGQVLILHYLWWQSPTLATGCHHYTKIMLIDNYRPISAVCSVGMPAICAWKGTDFRVDEAKWE